MSHLCQPRTLSAAGHPRCHIASSLREDGDLFADCTAVMQGQALSWVHGRRPDPGSLLFSQHTCRLGASNSNMLSNPFSLYFTSAIGLSASAGRFLQSPVQRTQHAVSREFRSQVVPGLAVVESWSCSYRKVNQAAAPSGSSRTVAGQ